MLDIYTCIISCMVFSDLLLDIYFHDTDTWDSCDMHYLDYMIFLDWPCDFKLVILWSWDYVTWYLFVQDISCSLYPCHNVHARSPCIWSIVSIFLLLLLLLVLSTSKHIVLLISMPYLYCYCILIFSLILFFSFVYSCWSASDGPLLFFSI